MAVLARINIEHIAYPMHVWKRLGDDEAIEQAFQQLEQVEAAALASALAEHAAG